MTSTMDAINSLATLKAFVPAGTAQVMLVLGAVGLGLLIMISVRGKIARRNAGIPSPRDQIDNLKAQSTSRQDIDAIQASLQDVARKLSAQLDNKAARLEMLIEQADERLARLNATHTQARGASAPMPTSRRVISSGPPERPAQSDPAEQAKMGTTSAAPRAQAEPTDALRRAIYALADKGRSALDIARELDEHIGKIELILALRHG